MSTVKRVFYAVAKDNLHTRNEIADALSISVVSVCKALSPLVSSGVLSADAKNPSASGRRSDFIDINHDMKVLLINLCHKNFSYSLSPLCEPSLSERILPCVDSLDFEGNLSLLIADMHKRISSRPYKVAVALPGVVSNGRIESSFMSDYSGFDVAGMLADNGFSPDVFVSGAEAVECSDEFCGGDAFISADDTVWGTFGRKKVEMLSEVPVDASGRLTYAEALRCSQTTEGMIKYSVRFLRAVNGVLSPKRILFSCDFLSAKAKSELEAQLPYVKYTPSSEIVLDGLMELVRDNILKEIQNKR